MGNYMYAVWDEQWCWATERLGMGYLSYFPPSEENWEWEKFGTYGYVFH